MFEARRDEDPTSDCDHRETVPCATSVRSRSHAIGAYLDLDLMHAGVSSRSLADPINDAMCAADIILHHHNQPTNQPTKPTRPADRGVSVSKLEVSPADRHTRPTDRQISQSYKAPSRTLCYWPALSLSVSLWPKPLIARAQATSGKSCTPPLPASGKKTRPSHEERQSVSQSVSALTSLFMIIEVTGKRE
ncbi:hypothetical protein Pmani_017734 [Petrolisthes manimaculis]|uniref:Uncharacterized protein n=1 Tax=Petrolisthes manimaculis TaxID=1843537 RepID=A0AAE1PNW7_9EUCA|nr:hypothetical protein Pmani_017734 [Petrolisthes manimaculis]